jgi:hypothetical protein
MRKLLGTLKVYETDEDCVTGLFTKKQRTDSTPGQYELRMCPQGTRDGMGLEQSNRVQIFAHELGHFAANVLQTPIQVNSWRTADKLHSIGLTREDGELYVPVEREAWQIADMIFPGASKSKAHDYGMKEYARHDKMLQEVVPPYVLEALNGK